MGRLGSKQRPFACEAGYRGARRSKNPLPAPIEPRGSMSARGPTRRVEACGGAKSHAKVPNCGFPATA
jgi:hypothetical protein